MSREIKFRMWDKTEKAMLSWEDINYGFRLVALENAFNPIMQFTGLKDKNGKEIYEGDIVRFPHYFGNPKPCKNCGFIEHEKDELICSISYRDGAPVHNGNEWSDDGLAELEGNDAPKVEVIGNIYENPELLK